MGPSGLLDNDLHALRALRPCDPRNVFFYFFRFLFQNFFLSYFSGRFDTSGYILPLAVPEIEGGYPERDGEEEEEGQFLQYSRSLMCFNVFHLPIMSMFPFLQLPLIQIFYEF